MNLFQLMPITVLGVLVLLTPAVPAEESDEAKPTVAIIGTGDMGDSLGPRFVQLGYPVVYGSRNPQGEKAKEVARQTDPGVQVTTQKAAAQLGDIVILAVPWPAMEAFALQASYVIDDPEVVGGPVSIPTASDDREAKEQIAGIIAAMGLDPVDAGPLRLSRELEAMQRLYGVPFFQRRQEAWEFYFRSSSYWECLWQDDWSEPVADARNLAQLPQTQGQPRPCPGI